MCWDSTVQDWMLCKSCTKVNFTFDLHFADITNIVWRCTSNNATLVEWYVFVETYICSDHHLKLFRNHLLSMALVWIQWTSATALEKNPIKDVQVVANQNALLLNLWIKHCVIVAAFIQNWPNIHTKFDLRCRLGWNGRCLSQVFWFFVCCVADGSSSSLFQLIWLSDKVPPPAVSSVRNKNESSLVGCFLLTWA